VTPPLQTLGTRHIKAIEITNQTTDHYSFYNPNHQQLFLIEYNKAIDMAQEELSIITFRFALQCVVQHASFTRTLVWTQISTSSV
jgi:hypothetical protein